MARESAATGTEPEATQLARRHEDETSSVRGKREIVAALSAISRGGAFDGRDRRWCGVGGRREGDGARDTGSPRGRSAGTNQLVSGGPLTSERAAAADEAHAVRSARRLPDDTLWDAEAVARYLTVSRSMVYKLEQAGELPCLRIGACIRFEPATVRAYARGELIGNRRTERLLARRPLR